MFSASSSSHSPVSAFPPRPPSSCPHVSLFVSLIGQHVFASSVFIVASVYHATLPSWDSLGPCLCLCFHQATVIPPSSWRSRLIRSFWWSSVWCITLRWFTGVCSFPHFASAPHVSRWRRRCEKTRSWCMCGDSEAHRTCCSVDHQICSMSLDPRPRRLRCVNIFKMFYSHRDTRQCK